MARNLFPEMSEGSSESPAPTGRNLFADEQVRQQPTPEPGTLTPEEYAAQYGDQPDIYGLMKPDEPKPEPSIGEKAIGAGEAALSTATAATGGLAGQIYGTLKGLAQEIKSGEFGTSEAADRIENMAAQMSQELTYAPRTETGQEYVEDIGELGEQLAPLAGLGGMTAGAGRAAKIAGQKAAARPSVASRMPERRPIPMEVQRSEETEIPLTAGEASKSTPEGFSQLKAEQFLLEQSGEAGDLMRTIKLNQSREIKKYLEGLSPGESGDIGQVVKQAIEARESSVKANRTQAYNKLAEVSEGADVGISGQPIRSALPDAGELRDFAAINSGQHKALSNLLSEFGIGPSVDGIPVEPLTVSNFERFRKRLNAIENSDKEGNTSRIVGPIRRAADEEFESAAKALEQSGKPDVALAAKNARLAHVAYKTEFDDKSMVSQLVADKSFNSRIPSIEESQVYSKLVAKSTPVEQFDRVVKSLRKEGAKGDFALRTMKSEMILDLLDSSYNAASRTIQGERTFSGSAFSKRFDQIEPKLKKVFTPEEFSRLKAMRKQAEDLVPPSGAIPKGSAGFFIDAAAKLGVFALLNKVPTIGPVIANQVQEMGKRAQSMRLAERAGEGYTPPPDLVNLIKTNYPGLEAAILPASVSGVATQAQQQDAQ